MHELFVDFSRRQATIFVGQKPNDPDAVAISLPAIFQASGVTLRELQAMWQQSRMPTVGHFTVEDLLAAAVPDDCTGMTVLDIGGWDGRFAELAHKRGAARAICLDSEQWRQYSTWNEPEHRPGVEYVKGDFRQWTGPVDYVLLYNVIYHVEDPRTALAHLRSITRVGLSIASITIWDEEPVWRPLGEREWNPDDPTDFWAPSDAGLVRLLQITGWKDIRQVGKAFDRLVLVASV